PDRALVALRPEACRRDIAERLADTGAGLGDDDIGLPARLARREGVRGFGSEIRLLLACLGAGADEFGKPRPCLRLAHGQGARRTARRALFPFGQIVPDIESAPRLWPPLARGHIAERCEDARPPGPACL